MSKGLNYSIEVLVNDEEFEWELVAYVRGEELAYDVARIVGGRYIGKLVEVNAMLGDGRWDTIRSFTVTADDNYANSNSAQVTCADN